jgi:hypothetical protein
MGFILGRLAAIRQGLDDIVYDRRTSAVPSTLQSAAAFPDKLI